MSDVVTSTSTAMSVPVGAGVPQGGGDVIQQPVQPVQPGQPGESASPRLIPETDLQRFQSKADQKIAALQKQLQELQTQTSQQQEQTELRSQAQQLYDGYYAYYQSFTEDPAVLDQWAREATAEKLETLTTTRKLQKELQSERATNAQTRAAEQRKALLGEIMQEYPDLASETGRQALYSASADLDRDDPNFGVQLWRAAARAARTLQSASAGQEAATDTRDFINQLPTVGAGASAQGPSTLNIDPNTGKPIGVERWDPRYAEVIREQRKRAMQGS